MTRMRIYTTLLLGCLIASLLVTACKSAAPPAPIQKKKAVTITFALPGRYEAQYRSLADAFEAENPDVRVQLLFAEEILGQGQHPHIEIDPTQARQLMTAADTAIMAVSPDTARLGLVRDLGPFIEADEDFHPEDFYPNTLESLRWDGGTWGLPFGVDFEVIYYDKDALDAAGLSHPRPDWTWDEFSASAIALTRREGNEIRRWGFVPILETPFLLIRGKAGPLLDTTSQPSPVVLLDRLDVAEALVWLQDLVLVQGVIPPPSGEKGWAGMRPVVDAKQAAMWSDTSARWGVLSRGRNLGMAPFPTTPSGEPDTGIYLRSYVMSAGTAHPEASWRWLAFLTRQGKAPLYTYSVPARRSVAEASGYWEKLPPEMRETLRYAFEHSVSVVGPGLSEVETALTEALAAVLEGQTPEEALRKAQSRATAQIVQAYRQPVTPVPIVVATPRVEEVEPGGTKIIFVDSRFGGPPVSRKLANAFHELHPEIHVEVREPDWEAIGGDSRLVLQQGDCAVADMWMGQRMDFQGTLLSLQPFLDADPNFPLDDYYPHFLEVTRRDGQLWALPLEARPRVIYYNKSLFDAAGLSYPSPDWTLEDFQALAMALTKGEGPTRQYGYMPDPNTATPLFWIVLAGAQLVDDRVTPTRYPFTSPATVAAVRWYADLVRTIEMPDILGITVAPIEEFLDLMPAAKEEARSLISADRAAMWSGYLGLNPPPNDEVEQVTTPQGPGRASDFYLYGLMISAQATPSTAQACWKWFTFLSEQPTTVEGFPARRSVLESAAYQQHVGTELASLYATIAERLGSGYELYKSAFVEHTLPTVLFTKAYKAVKGGEDPMVALGEAERKAEMYAQCIALSGRKDRETIKKCTQEVLGRE